MSTSTTAASLPAAAVTMLRVYCSWPGASAMMNLRVAGGEVAVGHVDGDALLAFGLQAVGEQAQVDRVAGRAALQHVCSWSARMAWLSNSRRPISVLLPSSTLPAVRKRSARCRWRLGSALAC
jgi:hypothetical protein